MMASEEIQTFVIFDLESTGLKSPGNNPRITELCFLAYGRNELLTKSNRPRVCHKLVLCLDPLRPISPIASKLSGLFNDALEGLPTFGKQASLIVSFLKNLPSPVCLVAHNGYRFDFPFFKAELRKCGRENDIDDILWADSLWAFRNLDGLPAVPEEYQHEIARLGICPNGEFSTPVKSTRSNDMPPNPLKRGSSLVLMPGGSVRKTLKFDDSEIETHSSSSSPENGASISNEQVSASSVTLNKPDTDWKEVKRSSYSLQNLFSHFFNQAPPAAHEAADDCETLLKIMRLPCYCKSFLAWCDRNALPFDKVEPMYYEK